MGLLNTLFGKREKSKESVTTNPNISTDRLMTSQLPALYLSENNPVYRERYVNRLDALVIKRKDTEKLFEFECDVIRKHGKQYLLQPQFTYSWFFGLQQPFFIKYPRSKEDIIKEKFFTMSELCKVIDEAEWHFWNSHERELPNEV